ncbi:MAG: hypothetical protein ACXWJW_12555 [Xanthobacteraceae bacterium]
MPKPFTPTARQSNCLIAVGLLSIGYAIYLRYMIVENVPAGLSCDAGRQSWLCMSRQIAGTLDNSGAFGWIALIFAVAAFIRPGAILLSIALAATAIGLVMHNAGLAGIAAGLIVLSFARPVLAPE